MSENYKTDFGKRLKAERKKRNLTQERMAELLSISLKHYGAVERGITGLSTEHLIELSNLLGLSLDYLLKGEQDKELSALNEVEKLYLCCPPQKRIHLLSLLRSALALSSDDFTSSQS